MFNAQIVSVQELLAILIQAPSFQRSFAWTSKEAGQLLDDVGVALDEAEAGANGEYFLGTMGKPPTLDPTDKEVLTAIDIIVKTTRKWGHIAGVHTDGPATALKRFDAGFQMCTILNDVRLLAVAAANAINEVRGKAPAAKAKTY